MDPDHPTRYPHLTRVYYTVREMAEVEEDLTYGAIRTDLFHRRSNGLEESGAVIRRGRRLLLHGARYLDWLDRRGRERSGQAA